MTEQTNTPELRFPEYKNEWDLKKIGNLANIVRGASPRPIKDSKWFDDNSEVGWLRISDVTQQNGKIKFLQQHLSTEGQKKTRVLHEPHLLLSIAASVGKPVINYVKTGVHDGFLIFMKPKFNLYFMFNWLENFQLKWNKYGQPGSQVNLNSDLVRSQDIYIPHLYEEQEKIGNFFNKLDRQIELEEEKLELLEQQKRGYMQKIFSQELRFKDDNGNEYPEWQFKNLGELGESFTGLSGKTKDDFGYGDGLFITYMNVFKNTIAKSNMVERVKIGSNENQNRVQYGDILFTTSSEVPNEVGMSSIWLFNQDNVYLNSFCFGFRIVVNYIKPVYLARYLRSEEMRKTITILAQGSTRFNISKKEMMKLNIKVPYIEEQNKIDNFFNKIDKYIEKQSEKIELLKERKKGLLQKMFI